MSSPKRIALLEHSPAQPNVAGFVESLPAHSNGLRVILVSDQKIYTSYGGEWLTDTPQNGWTCYADYPGIDIIYRNGEWVEHTFILDTIELPSEELPSQELPSQEFDPNSHPELVGEDGREVELQVTATHIQWRYVGEATWVDLIALSLLDGEDGLPGDDGVTPHIGVNGNWYIGTTDTGVQAEGQDGVDGVGIASITLFSTLGLNKTYRITFTDATTFDYVVSDGADGNDGTEIELQTTATHIQWRYVGDPTWINLVALSLLEGEDGLPGDDGREIELQVNATHIQWRYVGDPTWVNLIALSVITGADGNDGTDGREVELQVTATHIQWRYVGEANWINLIAITELQAAQIQSDYEQENPLEVDYIKNRPPAIELPSEELPSQELPSVLFAESDPVFAAWLATNPLPEGLPIGAEGNMLVVDDELNWILSALVKIYESNGRMRIGSAITTPQSLLHIGNYQYNPTAAYSEQLTISSTTLAGLMLVANSGTQKWVIGLGCSDGVNVDSVYFKARGGHIALELRQSQAIFKGKVTAGAAPTTDWDLVNLAYFTANMPASLAKAIGTEINTGTDDAKYVTSKAIHDSNIIRKEKSGQFSTFVSKDNIHDSDHFPIEDSQASNVKKKVIWARIKADLKTYFDNLYTGSGVDNFLDLTDTPNVFTNSALYIVRVNSTTNALEFVSKIPRTQVGPISANKLLGNSGETEAANINEIGVGNHLSFESGNLNADIRFPVVSLTLASTDLTAANHAQKFLNCNKSTAMTLNISSGFTIDSEIIIYQMGAGQVTVQSKTGAGQTINSTETLKSEKQNAVMALKCVAANTWVLFGERELL